MADSAPLIRDSLASAPLRYSNEHRERFQYTPAEFAVQVNRAAVERVYGPARRLRLAGPPGWAIVPVESRTPDPPPTLTWRVRPDDIPPACLVNLRLLIDRQDGHQTELVHPIAVEIWGRTQFDPRRHALPFANSAAEFGAVAPDPAVFAETYRRAPLGRAFFQGLYSDVVFLVNPAPGERPGGLCTGLARSALEASLSPTAGAADQPDPAAQRHAATVWHGKQLADRALMASTAAWLTHGSRDAYRAFRAAVLTNGATALAMDVNVPRPWRRDLVSAFIGSGHTVVPYALRQRSDDTAEVWVYDPNHPRPDEMRQSVIHFDLARDTYTYRHFRGSWPGKPSKVLAIHQDHYRAADTAVVGGLVSLALYPHTWLPDGRAPAPQVMLGLLLGLVLGLLLGRGASHRQGARSAQARHG